MNEEYIISFYSVFYNKIRYYKNIINYGFLLQQKLLNSTEYIEEAFVYTNYEVIFTDMNIIKLKFGFNDNEIRLEDITKYTKYNRFEIIDI